MNAHGPDVISKIEPEEPLIVRRALIVEPDNLHAGTRVIALSPAESGGREAMMEGCRAIREAIKTHIRQCFAQGVFLKRRNKAGAFMR